MRNEPKKYWPGILSGAASLFLMMSLVSCATLPEPPKQYLEDCKLTYLTDGEVTNGDLVRLAKDREYDMKLCNLEKRALRAWYEGYKASKGWWYRHRSD